MPGMGSEMWVEDVHTGVWLWLHSALRMCTTHVHYACALCMCATHVRYACTLCMCAMHVRYACALCMCATIVRCICPGSVTHAGLPIESGQRCVFVASFSPKASADGPARRVPTSISAATQSAIWNGEVEQEQASSVGSVGAPAPACSSASQTATASHRRMAAILRGR